MDIRSSRGLILSLIIICAIGFGILGIINLGNASIIVEWTTASELDTIGFNIYRAESLEAQLIRINDSLIPASPDPWIGGEYSFVDSDLNPGVVYFYYLEDVAETGETTINGPTEVMAKGGGTIELLISFMLFGLTLVGWFILRQSNRFASVHPGEVPHA